MDSIAGLRWQLYRAALRKDWDTYAETKEVLDQIFPPPPLPRLPNYEYFDPPCGKCGERITCERCLADLEAQAQM